MNREEGGKKAFENVQKEGDDPQRLSSTPHDVGGPDIAASHFSGIGSAGEACEE